MIKSDRQARIMSILDECDQLSIHELARCIGRVSSVTIRRDVAELAARGLIERTHGGVARLHDDRAPEPEAADMTIQDQIGDVDAIVLPPIEGRGADTLRSMARRRRIPFLAESSEQEGGVYIGPDNFAAGRELGHCAARALAGKIDEARILLVSLERLPNTRSRCDGFLKGFSESFKGPIHTWRVDGRGRFRVALSAALDAFTVHPDINVVFGVNDHSVLAALEASDRCGVEAVHGFCVGGEGGQLFDLLKSNRKLHACAALFPEIVGILSVDFLASALGGQPLPAEIRTPRVILTAENLSHYYRREPEGWMLQPQAEASLLPARPEAAPARPPRAIGFVPHYPAHDWYRNMIRAMRQRADTLGYEMRVAAPQAGIAREIQTLRRQIAGAAAGRITPGDTIILDAGEISLMVADELLDIRDITVVTNSLDVMERLSSKPHLKVILTSGEYQARHRCLVGPSLGALFETLRVDKAFLAVDGITARFGPSSADERLALAARRFVAASKEVFVLADHSIIGVDANNRIAPLGSVTEIITDSGSLPADRLTLKASGTAVTVAGSAETDEDAMTDMSASGGVREPAAV